jgi:hypothetical protein
MYVRLSVRKLKRPMMFVSLIVGAPSRPDFEFEGHMTSDQFLEKCCEIYAKREGIPHRAAFEAFWDKLNSFVKDVRA